MLKRNYVYNMDILLKVYYQKSNNEWNIKKYFSTLVFHSEIFFF